MKNKELIAFEEDIKQEFLAAKIHAPCHLSGGNEDDLIKIFQDVGPQDWVFSTWRSHYHALLKGIDPKWLKDEIMAGRSMSIMSPEHKFFSSSIVGGIVPIALGVAMGIAREGGEEKVWCFVGDMAASTGVFNEAAKYANGHNLPIIFVEEDNGFSSDTPTKLTWGLHRYCCEKHSGTRFIRYKYQRTEAHCGAGRWVTFA